LVSEVFRLVFFLFGQRRHVGPNTAHWMAEEDAEVSSDQAGPPRPKQKEWDISQSFSSLRSASKETIVQTNNLIEEKEARIRVMRTNIVATSKLNFERERQLDEVDKRIKLLVKNRIKLEDAASALDSKVVDTKADEKDATFLGKRAQYEELFRHLQSRPEYLAKMARLVEAKQVPSFVQTVVFDMYGDQYEDRDERLLLLCFRHALQDEVSSAANRGSLFRANTAVTQMLSAYARRGQGLAVLRTVLEEPLKALTSRKDLNLEISPQKVYAQLIQDSEKETGQVWAEERSVSDEVAAAHPVVKKIIEQHCVELLEISDHILNRIVEGVDKIPMGMRWVCKQLGDLCREKFADADRYQIGSLIGGYIYLRFFNPVIVTPDALNFIQVKPSRIMRRNLILIAKVLQNLSNGLEFGDKEQYMRIANPFIQARKDQIQAYFEKLADVDDLEDSWEIDKYQEHMSNKPMNLLLSQIFLCHNILWQNLAEMCPENDPQHAELRKHLLALKEPKPFPDDRVVVLQMANAGKHLDRTWDADLKNEAEQTVFTSRAKELLLAVATSLPEKSFESAKGDLIEFLVAQKTEALANNTALAEKLVELIAVLKTLNDKGLLKQNSKVLSLTEFLAIFAREVQNGHERLRHLTKRLDLIQSADQSISAHHTYLESRLDLYRMYLENVKKGGTTLKETTKKKVKDEKKSIKFSLQTLLDENVVTKVGSEIPKKFYKKVYFRFAEVSPAVFKVEVTLKEGIELNVLDKPLDLALDELLRKQEAHEDSLRFDSVELNINILIRFLNQHFVQA